MWVECRCCYVKQCGHGGPYWESGPWVKINGRESKPWIHFQKDCSCHQGLSLTHLRKNRVWYSGRRELESSIESELTGNAIIHVHVGHLLWFCPLLWEEWKTIRCFWAKYYKELHLKIITWSVLRTKCRGTRSEVESLFGRLLW